MTNTQYDQLCVLLDESNRLLRVPFDLRFVVIVPTVPFHRHVELREDDVDESHIVGFAQARREHRQRELANCVQQHCSEDELLV